MLTGWTQLGIQWLVFVVVMMMDLWYHNNVELNFDFL
jgi:hypothetical protein